MLDKTRIDEAEANVRTYLSEGLLKKIDYIDTDIFNIFLKNSEDSLNVADHLFKNNMSPLWVIVCSYYSMYYMANAILYDMGYKIGHRISHKVTSDSLIIFVRDRLKQNTLSDFENAKIEAQELAGLKTDKIIESFDFERNKRSRFQYAMSEPIKISKSETSLARAKSFIFELEKLL